MLGQFCLDGIVNDVGEVVNIFIFISNNPIKVFILPERTGAVGLAVDCSCGVSFEVRDPFAQIVLVVHPHQHMDMIWHDDQGIDGGGIAVAMFNTFDEASGVSIRKGDATDSLPCDEVGCVGELEVRKISLCVVELRWGSLSFGKRIAGGECRRDALVEEP